MLLSPDFTPRRTRGGMHNYLTISPKIQNNLTGPVADKMGSVTDELAKEVSALFEGEIVKPGKNIHLIFASLDIRYIVCEV